MLDLLIRNGHVIDPASQISSCMDLGVYNGRMVPVQKEEPARCVIEAKGKLVFPGLIDAHAHMFDGGSDIGICPDAAYLPTGVTAAIDCTTGVSNYQVFRSSIVTHSKVTIKSFLQVCSAGLTTSSYHENIDPQYFNPEKIDRIFHENQDNILGLKIRFSEELTGSLGTAPLKAASEIAKKINCPLEVHCTNLPVPAAEVLKILRSGDIFEHVYQGVKNTILDSDGTLHPEVWEARKRGILFDTAEGRKHADFDVMESAMKQGFLADFCSTDLVAASMYRQPLFSLPNLMSRYVCMGVSLEEVIRMTTMRPAKLMHMEGEIGCLSEGARADIAIFDWLPVKRHYHDWKGRTFTGDRILKPEMTIKGGQILYCAPDYDFEN